MNAKFRTGGIAVWMLARVVILTVFRGDDFLVLGSFESSARQ